MVMDKLLQNNSFYLTQDGRIANVYYHENIGSQYGSQTGRVSGLPGTQMWHRLGGGHIGNVSDWYSCEGYYKPIPGMNLVSRATDEEIEQYHQYNEEARKLLDTQAVETFVSFESFSRWIAQHATDPLVEWDHPGVDLVRAYLASWQGDTFALLWERWTGYYCYGAVVGIEFAGLVYLRLPNFYRVLQRKVRWDKKTYADLFAGIYDKYNPLVWLKDREYIFMQED